MNRKKIEQRIEEEFKEEVPNVLEKIMLSCKGEERMNENKENKVRDFALKPILRFASAFIFILMIGIGSVINFKINNAVETTIALDVNPSVEIQVNKKNRIIKAYGLNNDGMEILKDMDLKGADLNTGVNAIIGSMIKYGYMDDFKNSILISVNSSDKVKSVKIQQELMEEVNSVLKGSFIEPAIATQQYSNNREAEEKAKKYGISKGKVQYIENILEGGISYKDGKDYNFDNLVDLNINELNTLLDSKNKEAKNVNSVGESSTKAYIGNEKAKLIAIGDAGLNETEIDFFEIELDYENGIIVYELSFDFKDKEYEYEINAITGEITGREINLDDDITKVVNETQNNSNNISAINNENTKPTNNTSDNLNNNNHIGYSKAKSIALNNAGVNEKDIRDLDIELDRKNGKWIYEISFEFGNREYEYKIDAITGKILQKHIEIND